VVFEGAGESGFGDGHWTCTRPAGLNADHTIPVTCKGTIGYPWLVTPAPVAWPGDTAQYGP
jgi:hypothetical protein